MYGQALERYERKQNLAMAVQVRQRLDREKEVRRLVDEENVPENQARAIVTERRLDVVIGGSGASGPRVPPLLGE